MERPSELLGAHLAERCVKERVKKGRGWNDEGEPLKSHHQRFSSEESRLDVRRAAVITKGNAQSRISQASALCSNPCLIGKPPELRQRAQPSGLTALQRALKPALSKSSPSQPQELDGEGVSPHPQVPDEVTGSSRRVSLGLAPGAPDAPSNSLYTSPVAFLPI